KRPSFFFKKSSLLSPQASRLRGLATASGAQVSRLRNQVIAFAHLAHDGPRHSARHYGLLLSSWHHPLRSSVRDRGFASPCPDYHLCSTPSSGSIQHPTGPV